MSDHGQYETIPLPLFSPSKPNEGVHVAVDFKGPFVKPLIIVWRKHRSVVEKVHDVKRVTSNGKSLWLFMVSDNINCYSLHFDPENLRWTLIEIYPIASRPNFD